MTTATIDAPINAPEQSTIEFPYLGEAMRGAGLLDEIRPGWFRRINLDLLSLANGCNCIVGQLEGPYKDNIDKIMPGSDQYDQFNYGFLMHSMDPMGYPKLTRAWQVVIRRRLLDAD